MNEKTDNTLTNSDLADLSMQKNNQYRDKYRRTLGLLLAMAAVCVTLTMILTYLSVSTKKPKYFATTTAGVVIPMHSLSEPVVTSKYLLQWAALATRTAYNLSFVGYQDQLKKAEPFFTPNAWQQFLTALKGSDGLLKTVESRKLQMSAVVSGAPVILNSGEVHGRFTWRIQLPLLVTFTSANETTKTKLLVTMNISRVPVLSAPKGIQISDFESGSNNF